MSELIHVVEADQCIQRMVTPSDPIRCPLDKAAGRVLREDILADRPLPPFDRVMMDGYALRYKAISDGQLSFRVCGQSLAGDAAACMPEDPLVALEIMTGATLPVGADVIIPYEVVARTGDSIKLLDPDEIEPRQYIHALGSDFAAQSKLVGEGTLLGPIEIGVAASCGYAEVQVSQQARIAVVGTGDELVPVSHTPRPHQIRASNASTLEATLALARFNVGEVLHWPDDPERGTEQMRVLLERSDVVVIAGAVSKGKRDWIPGALDEFGECLFHGVKQRPGKPMGLWKAVSGCAVFALPGNPVSAIVGLHRYVLPYLRRREGQPTSLQSRVRLTEPVALKPPLTWFLPVRLLDDGSATPHQINNSGDYARLVGSDGFIELSADCSEWTAGFEAPFYPWST